jgi:hypothetical protein
VRIFTHYSPAINKNCMSFYISLAEQTRYGAYFEHHNLSLSDGSIEDWADTVAWFLTLLPADAQTVCLLEAVPIPTPLPNTCTAEEAAAILNELDSRW